MVKVYDKHGMPHVFKEAQNFNVDKERVLTLSKQGPGTPSQNQIAAFGPGMCEWASTAEEQPNPDQSSTRSY
ncbi:MAG: hypothetical protein M3256_18155 [Actinomycetota bacterium]|nr:hypothetical protein [Actinomycetota bacterium]